MKRRGQAGERKGGKAGGGREKRCRGKRRKRKEATDSMKQDREAGL